MSAARTQSRSSSLMLVLERVCASTRLDDHGAVEGGAGRAVGQGLPGIAPGTTTE